MIQNDFTLSEYTYFLKALKEHYTFINYESVDSKVSPSIIWRHDVDVSIHNAQKLAKIETNLGIQATYFLMLSNWFYDIRDHEIHKLISRIAEDGHVIGLHYDFEYLPGGKVDSNETFIQSLRHQKNELEHILRFPIKVFSFHNPSTIDPTLLEKINESHIILDMVNVYSSKIQKYFKYCSDSNGLWRFDTLDDLINPERYPNLHILTHPEWWTEAPMTPREKIIKALSGRAKAILQRHDQHLIKNNRPNF
jgi:hypothetical protein